MADHPDITPDELKAAAEVFLATGSYSEAGRAINRNPSAIRKRLLAQGEPQRAALYTRALDEAFDVVVRASRDTLVQLRRDARHAKKPGDRANTAFALNDTARTIITARTAHAKLTGDHAPDKHAVTVDAVDEISRRIARLAESDEAG